MFSEIRQIKLNTFKEKSEGNSEKDLGNADNEPFEHEKDTFGGSETGQLGSQRVGVSSEQTVQTTGREEQTASFPRGFDPSVPPPTFMQQQPSWFPQQQTGTSFSAPQAFTGSENQSINAAHSQTQMFPEALHGNVINTNSILTGPGSVHGASESFLGSQTASNSANLYMGGLSIVTQSGYPLTQTQPSLGSGGFSQYTNALPTNGTYSQTQTYGNSGVNAGGYSQIQTQAAGYSQMQPVTNTQQKTVIPKMKILDTRLMQNEDD